MMSEMALFSKNLSFYVLILSSLFLLVLSSTSSGRVFLEHSLPLAPSHWRALGLARPDDQIELIFALKQRNLDTLQERFYQVSGAPRCQSLLVRRLALLDLSSFPIYRIIFYNLMIIFM